MGHSPISEEIKCLGDCWECLFYFGHFFISGWKLNN